MFGGLKTEDLIALRLELLYAAQKVERAMISTLTVRQHDRNPRIYTSDQRIAGQREADHADTMLRMAAQNLIPTFELLAGEAKVS